MNNSTKKSFSGTGAIQKAKVPTNQSSGAHTPALSQMNTERDPQSKKPESKIVKQTSKREKNLTSAFKND